MSRVYNFSAGPSMLAESVLKTAADEMLDYHGCGQSVMEMSHLLTLQGSVGKITLSPEAQGRADVDGDGKITVTDSLLILQRAVVKIDKFPVEK